MRKETPVSEHWKEANLTGMYGTSDTMPVSTLVRQLQQEIKSLREQLADIEQVNKHIELNLQTALGDREKLREQLGKACYCCRDFKCRAECRCSEDIAKVEKGNASE